MGENRRRSSSEAEINKKQVQSPQTSNEKIWSIMAESNALHFTFWPEKRTPEREKNGNKFATAAEGNKDAAAGVKPKKCQTNFI